MILGLTKDNMEAKFGVINSYMEKIGAQKNFGEYFDGGKMRLIKVMRIERETTSIHTNILKNREYSQLSEMDKALLNKSLNDIIDLINTPESKFQ